MTGLYIYDWLSLFLKLVSCLNSALYTSRNRGEFSTEIAQLSKTAAVKEQTHPREHRILGEL